MKRDSSMDSAIGILIILFCPALLLLPLLWLVWTLASCFIEQGKEDRKAEREREARMQELLRGRGKPLRPLNPEDRRRSLQRIQRKYRLTNDEIAVVESRVRPMG